MAIHGETIPELLAERTRLSPQTPAFLTQDHDAHWQSVNWLEFSANVSRVSGALLEAGIGRGDRVAIMAPTSLNWEYAQMGALAIAAAVAGVDLNYPPDQLAHVFKCINPTVLFVQNHAALSKIPAKWLEPIQLIILFEDNPKAEREISMTHLLAADKTIKHQGQHTPPEPHDMAIIVFSSGSTGMPKAIHYSHLQILTAIKTISSVFEDIGEDTVFLCWLPLANLFQRMVNFWAIGIGARSYILNDPRDLMRYIQSVNPHILIGVPRLFYRIQYGLVNHVQNSTWLVRYLIQRALSIGRNYALIRLSSVHHPGIAATAAWRLADKFVLSRLRAQLGSRLRYFISGSAAMPVELLEWFEGIGLPVLEAYGISENIIPIAINSPSLRKLETVGKPLFPNQIKLAQDGEILVRGPGVFHGYWHASSQDGGRFSDDGYWHTNDLGHLDEQGFLSLTGRKTEVFKTPEGKWVSPARLEAHFQKISFVEHCIIFQLNSGKIAALLSIDKARYTREMDSFTEISGFFPASELNTKERMLWMNMETILQQLPNYQRPIGIIVTHAHFTIEDGELTINMKLRRGAIINHYSHHIRQLEANLAEVLNNQQIPSDNNILKPTMLFV